MARKSKSSADIEAAIAALQTQLADAREAEQQRKWNELTRLLKRAGALDEALAWARSRSLSTHREAVSNGQ